MRPLVVSGAAMRWSCAHTAGRWIPITGSQGAFHRPRPRGQVDWRELSTRSRISRALHTRSIGTGAYPPVESASRNAPWHHRQQQHQWRTFSTSRSVADSTSAEPDRGGGETDELHAHPAGSSERVQSAGQAVDRQSSSSGSSLVRQPPTQADSSPSSSDYAFLPSAPTTTPSSPSSTTSPSDSHSNVSDSTPNPSVISRLSSLFSLKEASAALSARQARQRGSSSSSSSVSDDPQPPTASRTSLFSRVRSSLSAAVSPASETTTHFTPGQQDQTSSVRKLLALAVPEKRPLLIGAGLLLVSSSVSMSVPAFVGKLIDFFSGTSPTFLGLSSFPIAATMLGTFFVIGASANAGRAILMRLSGQRIVARIRERAYASTLRQEPEFAGSSAGDIVSRLSVDTGILGDSVTNNLSDGLRAMISAVVGIGAMFYISSKLTIVMLCVVPPISLFAVVYGRYIRRLSNLTQEAVGFMSRTAEEKLNAFPTLTAYGTQSYETDLFRKRVQEIFGLARKEAYMSGVFWGASGLTGNFALLCLLGYGGSLVSKGEISVGDLTSLLLYSAYVGGSVSGLTGFFTGLMKGVGAGTRVFSLLDRPSAIPLDVGQTLAASRNGPIRFEDVHFRYPSRREVEVLKGVSFQVGVGESVALVGSSGSGKSSVQALLLRFYDPDSGRVTFDGLDIKSLTPNSWRARIGVVFQDPILFAGTIHENIAYGTPSATRYDVESAARAANCDFIWNMPLGFDTPIDKSSLSGGQRQRLSIARALLRRPTILLLDEATSALDSASEAAVNAAIDRIIREERITVILAAHRLSSIARAERVVVIEDGKVTEQGRYDVLSRREGSRFRKLMAAQLLVEQNKGRDGIDRGSRGAASEEEDEVDDELEEGDERRRRGTSASRGM